MQVYFDDRNLCGNYADLNWHWQKSSPGLKLVLAECLVFDVHADVHAFPILSQIPSVPASGGFKLLCIPLGGATFIKNNVYRSLCIVTVEVRKFMDHHVASAVVCLGACRGTFRLRLLTFQICKQLAADLSIAMRRTLGSIAGLLQAQWRLLQP